MSGQRGGRHCECCGRYLHNFEVMICDDCGIARCEGLLASSAWMTVRGPYMADAIRAELASLKLSKENGR
jgi:hypothetical protein